MDNEFTTLYCYSAWSPAPPKSHDDLGMWHESALLAIVQAPRHLERLKFHWWTCTIPKQYRAIQHIPVRKMKRGEPFLN